MASNACRSENGTCKIGVYLEGVSENGIWVQSSTGMLEQYCCKLRNESYCPYSQKVF